MSTTSTPPTSCTSYSDSETYSLKHLAELEFLVSSKPSSETRLDYINSAPLVNKDASVLLDSESKESIFPFKSLLGSTIQQEALISGFKKIPLYPQLYLNIAAPFSAAVCGVQSSGKSHSLSVLLEGSFISNSITGICPAPLAGSAFHFGTTTLGYPAETPYLSRMYPQFEGLSQAPEVVVLVSPSSIDKMQRTYAPLTNVKLYPLRLAPSDLNSSRIVNFMGLDEGKVIFYMDSILAILRAQDKAFRSEVDRLYYDFSPNQKQGGKLRLNHLDSFVSNNSKTPSLKSYFKAGRLVLVDLSDPFLGMTGVKKSEENDGEEDDDDELGERAARFGRGYLKVKMRQQLTLDGGLSV